MRKKLEKFNSVLEKELETELDKIIAAGTINPTEVKNVTDAVCLMLKIKEYEEWLESEMDGYSSAMPMQPNHSYRRGRNPMNGQYVSRAAYMPSMSNRYYMNDAGYSGHSIHDRAIANLENMMNDAGNDYERQVLSGMIDELRMNNR